MSKLFSFRFISALGAIALLAGPALVCAFGHESTVERYEVFIHGAGYGLVALAIILGSIAVNLYLRPTVRDPSFLIIGVGAIFVLFLSSAALLDPIIDNASWQHAELGFAGIAVSLSGLALAVIASMRYRGRPA